MTTNRLSALALATILVGAPVAANAQDFTPIDFPGSSRTEARGVDGGNLVGSYRGALDSPGTFHGFLYDGATYTPLDYPGAISTEAYDISGTRIVGTYRAGPGQDRGFVYDGADWATISYPGNSVTYATGIDGNNIVGHFFFPDDPPGRSSGFLYDGADFTRLDYPGANWTQAHGISGNKIVGTYYDEAAGRNRGFLYDGATWSPLIVPDSNHTIAYGIEGNHIVGEHTNVQGDRFGFVYDGDTWSSIPLPFPFIDSMSIHGISGDQIVGTYHSGPDSSGFQTARPVPPVLPKQRLFRFSGEITSVDDDHGWFNGAFQVGQQVQGNYNLFEGNFSSAVILALDDEGGILRDEEGNDIFHGASYRYFLGPNFRGITPTPVKVQLDVGEHSYETGSPVSPVLVDSPYFFTIYDDRRDTGDQYVLQSSMQFPAHFSNLGALSQMTLSLALTDPTGTAFDSYFMPLTAPPLSQFASAIGRLSIHDFVDNGHPGADVVFRIDSLTLVPEPAAGLLLGVGFGVISAVRRRRPTSCGSAALRITLMSTLLTSMLVAERASAITWTTIDYPGAQSTVVNGIDGNIVVGTWGRETEPYFLGFNFDGISYTLLDLPIDHRGLAATGISGNTIVGSVLVPWPNAPGRNRGFIYDGASYSLIDWPDPMGAEFTDTYIAGIDGVNIVGSHANGSVAHGGFHYDGVNWTAIDHPDGQSQIAGVDGSKVLGYYHVCPSCNADPPVFDFEQRAFVFENGEYTHIEIPGPVSSNDMVVTGISGEVVAGYYFFYDPDFDENVDRGFVFDQVNFTTLEYPGSISTRIRGIKGNTIVGSYRMEGGNDRGFLAILDDLPGDFNSDGTVDAADYTRWRDTGGTAEQFAAWKQNFGTTSPGLAAGSTAAGYPLGASADPLSVAIPEPATSVLLAVVFGLIAAVPQRRLRTRCRQGIARFALLLLLVAAIAPHAAADIYQWEYINPGDPSQGKQQSTTLAPDGAGVDAAPGANLIGRNLTMAYLIGANLSGASLWETVFADAELSHANLTDATVGLATLTGANLSQANLASAFFRDATLTGANLSQANLTNAWFVGSTFTGADFTGAEVPGTDFSSTNLTPIQLYSTASYQAGNLTRINLAANDMTGWNFAGQNLTNAIFQGATLDNADFSHANLTEAFMGDVSLVGAELSHANLSKVQIWSSTPINANFSLANLTGASVSAPSLAGADFTGAQVQEANFDGLSLAQLYSTASYQAGDLTGIGLGGDLSGGNFAGQNLKSANFGGTTLTGADFTGAQVQGASFHNTDLTPNQLYSTASYQNGDLSGIGLSSKNLDGWNFAGQNLRNAYFYDATFAGADFTGAQVQGATFAFSGLTAAQLYSTASYQAGDLNGIDLSSNNLSGWNFVGQNLTNAQFFDFDTLNGADLTGADTRGARILNLSGATTTNLLRPDGQIIGLNLTAGQALIVRDYDDDPNNWWKLPGPIPITIEQHMTMDASGTLRLVLEDDDWGSTISFVPGIPVALGGTLELLFAADVDVASQVGRTFDLFDWTGVTPTGAFNVASPYAWNLANLYTTGEATLLAATDLPGDFNNDGTVDAADYTRWRDTGGTAEQFAAWKQHFGTTSPGRAAGSTAAGYPLGASADPLSAAVPEPATGVLLAALGIVAAAARRWNAGWPLAALLLCLAIGPTSGAHAAATFMGLGGLPSGDLSSYATGVSADGSVVVGWGSSANGTEAFRWTADGGMVGLGGFPGHPGGLHVSFATGVSADGSIVVGGGSSANGSEAFRWTVDDGMVGLGNLPGDTNGGAYGISADGSVVVGDSWSAIGHEAFHWTTDGGMVRLGDLPGGEFASRAWGVSADGSVIVGERWSGSGVEAFRWTADDGMMGLGFLPGGRFNSRATGVSADGSVVVGESSSPNDGEAFRWTADGGMAGLGYLPDGGSWNGAAGVSADGSVVVGSRTSASGGGAFLWTADGGMESLRDILIAAGATGLENWDLSVTGISADGRTFVGSGWNPDGFHEAWLAVLPAPGLPGDFNGDGIVDAADYTRWRDTGGTVEQFAAWKQHFGTTSPGLAAGSGAAGYPLGASADPLSAPVPEPASLVLLLLAAVATMVSRPAIPHRRVVANNRC